MRGLAGKTAVVTGSGRGIGRAIAEELLANGTNVVVVDRDLALAESAAKEMAANLSPVNGTTPRVLPLTCDVSDPASIEQLFDAVQAELGHAQLLVNNVGGGREKRTLLEMTPEALAGAFSSNVYTTVLVSRTFANRLKEAGLGGAIVNLSSSAAVRPKGGRMQYSGAKAAVSAITQSMSVELAPLGIRVNAVCPGPTATQEIKDRFNDPVQRPIEEARLKKIPLGRLAETTDIADAATFLLSDMAGYITGVLLPVDGGYTVVS